MRNFLIQFEKNTFYSNQFRYDEFYSSINGEYVATFVRNVDKLVEVIKNKY